LSDWFEDWRYHICAFCFGNSNDDFTWLRKVKASVTPIRVVMGRLAMLLHVVVFSSCLISHLKVPSLINLTHPIYTHIYIYSLFIHLPNLLNYNNGLNLPNPPPLSLARRPSHSLRRNTPRHPPFRQRRQPRLHDHGPFLLYPPSHSDSLN
jgi:hypothetical protein